MTGRGKKTAIGTWHEGSRFTPLLKNSKRGMMHAIMTRTPYTDIAAADINRSYPPGNGMVGRRGRR